MAKILYIEDELTRNIATIRKFFEPILKKDKRIPAALIELENSDRLFAADIIEACKPCTELDIAHTFPRALELVITNHSFYDLIIIDRNLSLYQYVDELQIMVSKLNEIGQDFNEERVLEFHEREGDLLLQVLVRLDASYKDKVYYLTANTSDALRGSPQLQTLIDIDRFRQDHIIEKGSPKEKLISDILADMKKFSIQNVYKTQSNILRKHLDENSVNQFVNMIKHYDKDNHREFIFDLRNLLENILEMVAYNLGEHNADYWKYYGRKAQLQYRPFILYGLKTYDEKFNIGYNAVIQNACISIYSISSECVVHSSSKSVDIESISTGNLTQYTVDTLLNQICDVILWFGPCMEGLLPKE
ncbi:MAG: hypothetical protein LHW44_00315 [Candidatus Cloacimonetes bacterium]|nr:hypothetical protein [Candidatus Cloacimonadota bacterium]